MRRYIPRASTTRFTASGALLAALLMTSAADAQAPAPEAAPAPPPAPGATRPAAAPPAATPLEPAPAPGAAAPPPREAGSDPSTGQQAPAPAAPPAPLAPEPPAAAPAAAPPPAQLAPWAHTAPAATSKPAAAAPNADALAASAGPSAPAESSGPELEPVGNGHTKHAAPETPRLDGWLGVHSLIISSPGFDAFSEDDALTSFGAGVGVALGALGGARLAGVATLSIGGDEESFRGQGTELSVLRISLGPELRLPFAQRFFAYARLSPQLQKLAATLSDASSSTRLEQSEWLVGIDTALGLSMRLVDIQPAGLQGPLSLFVRFEAGYTWAPETEMRLAPAGSDGPIRSQPLALGDLSLSGLSFRGALGLGY